MEVPIAGIAERHDVLLRITPFFGTAEGEPWFRLLNPTRPTPPPELIARVGSGDFVSVALDVLGQLVNKAGLEPHQRVLDIGCGVGRVAYALTYFLDEGGSYEGIDIVPELIAWPREHLSPGFPRFRFRVIDAANGMYNPTGTVSAESVTFPYGNAEFDVLCLTSVFTHLRPSEARRYFSEIARLLRPAGRALCTAFLLNSEAEAQLGAGRGEVRPVIDCGEFHTTDADVPEKAVAYAETQFLGWAREAGLVARDITYGSWCGRQSNCYQDVLVFEQLSA